MCGCLTRRALLARTLAIGSTTWTLLVSGCTVHEPDRPPVLQRGGTLHVGKPEDILLAAVPHVLAPGNFPLYNLVYDRLVVYDQSRTPQPALATSWSWSADAHELTLKLRPGVTFH